MKQTAYKKLLESVASKQNSRPALKCIHYYKGNAYATDSHQLVKINYGKDTNEDYLIDTETGLPKFNKYPELDNLFYRTNQIDTQVILNYDSVAGILDYLKANKKEFLNLTINDNITITSKSGMVINVITKGINGLADKLDIHVNGLYLYNIFKAIFDLGKQYHIKEDIKLNFHGQLRPIQIEYPTIKFLATPLRVF